MIFHRMLSWLLAASLTAAAWSIAIVTISAVLDARRPAPVEITAVQGRELFTKIPHTERELATDGSIAFDDSPRSHRMFNARSCAECHRQGGIGGGGPNENNVRLINKTFTDREPQLAKHFGPGPGIAVLHRHSSAPNYAGWRLKLIEQLNPLDPEATRPIQLRLDTNLVPSFAPQPFEQRNTPPLFGLGLIETISQSEIDAGASRQRQAVRGRSPRLPGGGRGRFGWKSNTATLAAFIENACAVDLGLSTPRHEPVLFRPAIFQPTPFEPAPTKRQPATSEPFDRTQNSDTATGPTPVDVSEAELAALMKFVATLPAPEQRIESAPAESVAMGRNHFHVIGCAECHVPDLGQVSGVYSDLLLHTVGTSGGIYYGASSGSQGFDVVAAGEFRTPPLWGVADSAPYMHDGSAPTLERAILAHAGQASASRESYRNELTTADRSDLLTFLETLRAPR